jgi:hypothetical protein
MKPRTKSLKSLVFIASHTKTNNVPIDVEISNTILATFKVHSQIKDHGIAALSL